MNIAGLRGFWSLTTLVSHPYQLQSATVFDLVATSPNTTPPSYPPDIRTNNTQNGCLKTLSSHTSNNNSALHQPPTFPHTQTQLHPLIAHRRHHGSRQCGFASDVSWSKQFFK